MSYKIEMVSQTVREYDSKYGAMKSYKLKLEGVEEPVELSQKSTSPAPKVGDELEGTIDTSGEYGPKFKKAFGGGSGFSGGGKSFGSKPMADPFTMYLSYAKDIVVACIARGDKITRDEAVAEVITQGNKLYDARPEAVASAKAAEVISTMSQTKDTVIDDISDDPIDLSEIPF